MRRWIPFLLSTAALFAAGSAELERAKQLFSRSQYQAAIKVLAPAALSSLDPATQELLGKSYFMISEYKKAAEAFEKATTLDPKQFRVFSLAWKGAGSPRGNGGSVHCSFVCLESAAGFRKISRT